MATAAILDIKSHQNRQQCNLWTVMMCLCENNRIESWYVQMAEKRNITLVTYGTQHCMRIAKATVL